MTDKPRKPPERPDPFAPLPLANLPPVRRRGPLDPSEPREPSAPSAPAPPAATVATVAPATPAAPAAPPTEISGAMSWTDMPVPAGSPSGAPDTGTPPTETSGAMSWTDMPAPPMSGQPGQPMSGQPMSGAPDMPDAATDADAATAADTAAAADADTAAATDADAAAATDADAATAAATATAADTAAATTAAATAAAADAAAATDAAAADAPLLPSTYNENDLRAAVGATQLPQTIPGAVSAAKKSRRRAPTDDDDDGDDDDGSGRSKPRNRKMMLIGALTLAVGGAIATMVIVGKINSQRYLIACEADRVVVQQGRTFPPWGESTLDGAEWKALKIPPEAPCSPFETGNKAELAAHYLDILQDHATTLLTAREVTKIDDAEAQLKQALLVARSLGRDDERIDAREEIERLLGDVGYWRASAKLRSASEALTEAANEFDVAAKQRPRHVTDAAAWALYVRKLVEQLRTGPAGAVQATFPPLPPGERPTAPPGVALPVEPGAGSGSAVSEPEPPPPADAGLPTGGVLL